MEILAIMVPVFGIIALGSVLSLSGFLTETLTSGLNRIVYYVALPALLMRACAQAGAPALSDWKPLIAVAIPTLAVAGLAVLIGYMLRLEPSTRRAFLVVTFFGNLTYIGLPVMTHSLGLVEVWERPELLDSTIVVLILMNIAYNLVAVGILQPGGVRATALFIRILTNPILLAGFSGLMIATLGLSLPSPVELTLTSLGGMAIPAALLCIGSSLVRARFRSMMLPVVTAAFLKVFLLPLLAWCLIPHLGLSKGDARVAVILAACPTAVASYSLARELKCAPDFVAAAITLSTLLSAISLFLALSFT